LTETNADVACAVVTRVLSAEGGDMKLPNAGVGRERLWESRCWSEYVDGTTNAASATTAVLAAAAANATPDPDIAQRNAGDVIICVNAMLRLNARCINSRRYT